MYRNNIMESIKNPKLIHIAVELVVVAGLSFWFQRKTSQNKQAIEDLKGEVMNLVQIINQQQMMIENLTGILSRMLQQPIEVVRSMVMGQNKPSQPPSQISQPPQQTSHPPQSSPQPPQQNTSPVPPQNNVPQPNNEEDDEELDRILEEEEESIMVIPKKKGKKKMKRKV